MNWWKLAQGTNLEEQPYDSSVMNDMMKQWSVPGYKGKNLTQEADPNHIQEAQKFINVAKSKILSWLNSMPKEWGQYIAWEKGLLSKSPNTIPAAFFQMSDKLPSSIKDGGSNVAVSPNGNEITVPSSLYNVLRWRWIVKTTEKDINDIALNKSGAWNTKPRMLSLLRKLSTIVNASDTDKRVVKIASDHGDTLEGQLMKQELRRLLIEVAELREAAISGGPEDIMPRWKGIIRDKMIKLPSLEIMPRMSMGELRELSSKVNEIRESLKKYRLSRIS